VRTRRRRRRRDPALPVDDRWWSGMAVGGTAKPSASCDDGSKTTGTSTAASAKRGAGPRSSGTLTPRNVTPFLGGLVTCSEVSPRHARAHQLPQKLMTTTSPRGRPG
jgi:hypothetical protein